MTYTVKEIFYTIQGEGAHTGRAAVFCRFAGCNLWSGREEDRARAICRLCDTDFVGGETFATADDLSAAIAAKWPVGEPRRMVVFTGGEPALQLDIALLEAVKAHGFYTAIETNGTRPLPRRGLDWVCVSPKADADLVVIEGDELKLVFPQPGAEPERYAHLPFRNFSLSPLDNRKRHARKALAYCLAHPQWRLGTRLHQTVGFA